MSITWKDLDRLLAEFPDVEERTLFSSLTPECDESYIDHNLEAAVWLLDNADLILQALSTYCEDERPYNE